MGSLWSLNGNADFFHFAIMTKLQFLAVCIFESNGLSQFVSQFAKHINAYTDCTVRELTGKGTNEFAIVGQFGQLQ